MEIIVTIAYFFLVRLMFFHFVAQGTLLEHLTGAV